MKRVFVIHAPKPRHTTRLHTAQFSRHCKTSSLWYRQPKRPIRLPWFKFATPQFIAQNPDNGHAHYCYKLTEPVLLWGNAGEKPIKYLRRVHKALNKALGGDPSYSGNLIKNPFSSHHNIYITGAKPSYTLDELASYLELEYETVDPIDPAQNDDQYGRNCATFEYTRQKPIRSPSSTPKPSYSRKY